MFLRALPPASHLAWQELWSYPSSSCSSIKPPSSSSASLYPWEGGTAQDPFWVLQSHKQHSEVWMKPVAHIPMQFRERMYHMCGWCRWPGRWRHKLVCARKGDPPLFWWIAHTDTHTYACTRPSDAGSSRKITHCLSQPLRSGFPELPVIPPL